MNGKIKISTIIGILIYHAIFINFAYISNYLKLTYILIAIVFVMLIFKYKYYFNENYTNINIGILIFVFIIMVAGIYNKVNFFRGVIYAIKIIEVFFFFEYVHSKKEEIAVMNVFYRLTLIYVIVNDILLIGVPSLFNRYGTYLIGDKFIVSYMHLFLTVFYIALNNLENKKHIQIKVFAYVLVMLLIAIKIKCMTNVIGALLFITIYYLPARVKEKIANPNVIIATIIICFISSFMLSQIVNSKIAIYLIEDILKKDTTLTGRIYIYEHIMPMIQDHLYIGHGERK